VPTKQKVISPKLKKDSSRRALAVYSLGLSCCFCCCCFGLLLLLIFLDLTAFNSDSFGSIILLIPKQIEIPRSPLTISSVTRKYEELIDNRSVLDALDSGFDQYE
jgi:hypothetical protein